ncbi:MAG: cation transporter [Candidatus Rokubacteria bacterium]|nr:cation transporter [Candidatus Rokubacteria bacterium]
MKLVALVAAVAILISASVVAAAERTVKLDVANATCELCGPIVKRALTRVPGVLDVKVAETASAAVATVRFDDGRTDVASLITATTNAGYPSRVAK